MWEKKKILDWPLYLDPHQKFNRSILDWDSLTIQVSWKYFLYDLADKPNNQQTDRGRGDKLKTFLSS